MSKTGKQKAIIKVTSEMIKALAEAPKIDPLGAFRMGVIAVFHIQSNNITNTPHEYFNDSGRIDKRKKRRYDRKHGLSSKKTYLIRPNLKESELWVKN